MKIAIDTQVPHITIEMLEKRGHKVVCVARPKEPDLVWFHRAERRGALLVISNDKEVIGMTKVWDMIPMEIPDGIKGARLAKHIVLEVQKLCSHIRQRMPIARTPKPGQV